MRNLAELQQYRRIDWEIRSQGVIGDNYNGCFVIPYGDVELNCLASSGGKWDHVSVSTATRTPTWAEMSYVYSLFARPAEVWMQLHVPPRDRINFHPYCLHLWRHQSRVIIMPPSMMVGPKAITP